MKRERVTKVLELRDYRKQVLEMEVKRQIEEFDGEVRKLNALEEGFEGAVDEYHERHDLGGITIQELELFYSHLLHLKKRLEKQRETVRKKLVELEKKKSCLAEAHKEKRLVEILHGKLTQHEARERSAAEQREMDFRFISRFPRP